MPLSGEYVPNAMAFVRDQVEAFERSGGTEANTLGDAGWPIVIVTTRGAKSGKLRKVPLMRVEHSGIYALVASFAGAPDNPSWYTNIKANPDALMIQDGREPADYIAREIDGEEYAMWWVRAVAAYPPYAEYQEKTQRKIPIFLASPKD